MYTVSMKINICQLIKTVISNMAYLGVREVVPSTGLQIKMYLYI